MRKQARNTRTVRQSESRSLSLRSVGDILYLKHTLGDGLGFAIIFFLLFGVNVFSMNFDIPIRWPLAVLWWFFPYGFLLAWQTFISPDSPFSGLCAILFGMAVAFRCGQIYQL